MVDSATPHAQHSPDAPQDTQLEAELSRFGLRSFRPGQKEVISAVLSGQDCLCIMPTGGGKSLCYQLPAVIREGVTLVISPLIALMKDQVDSMAQLKIRATYINSSLSLAEQRARADRMRAGGYDLVYIAPERLRNPRFVDAVRQTRVNLLAVDEAHCVSEWGHDFRPDYARLGRFREKLGRPQTIALTATATAIVREDVVELLGLRQPKTFVTGFARPNLRFEVLGPPNQAEKDQALIEFLQETPGAGIVYAATRKRCEELTEALAAVDSRKVGLYHAGMSNDERRLVQESFMADQTPLIVATNAFGMGIDKRDLRFVVHYNMPRSLEAYYQEAGRAGRDGDRSRCMLLFTYSDRRIQEYFIENSYPSPDIVEEVYEYLRRCDQDPVEMTQEQLKEELDLGIGAEGVGASERLLEKAGALERLDSVQNMAAVKITNDTVGYYDCLPREAKVRRKVLRALERIVGDNRHDWVYFSPTQLATETSLGREAINRAIRELMNLRDFDYVPPFRGRAIHVMDRSRAFRSFDIDFNELMRRKHTEVEKLDRVVRFATTSSCRQLEILDYFGDTSGSACGACDNCAPGARRDSKPSASKTPMPVLVASDDDGVHEAVRIGLSGAARAKGRVGKNLLAKMLCGSQSTQVTKMRLDRLSTFGLLNTLKQSEAQELLDALIAVGLLEQVEHERFRPVVQITARGLEAMRSTETLQTTLPLSAKLLQKLRKRRVVKKPAQDLQPAGDSNPTEPAQNKPASAKEVSREAPKSAEQPQQTAPAAVQTTRQDPGPKPSYYWTWRLLSDGYTPSMCAQIRRLDPEEIIDHAIRAVENGHQVSVQWLLSPEQIAHLEELIGDKPPGSAQQLLTQLPAGTRLEHAQLFLKCRESECR